MNVNCWNRFGKEYAVSDVFLCHFFSCGQQLKITKLPKRENFEPTRKNFGHKKHPRENLWTYEIPARKHFRPTKYPRENNLDPRNSHKVTMALATRPAKFSALHRKQYWKCLHFSRTLNTLSLQALSLQKIF